MPNNSRKGGKFERDFSRILTTWWTGTDDNDVIFWRTAGSGGRATNRTRKTKDTNAAHVGDICSLGIEGKPLMDLITWEVKSGYPTAHLHAILDNPNTTLQIYEKWLIQALNASNAARTPYWAVAHHRNMRNTTITIPYSLWWDLGLVESANQGRILPPTIEMHLPFNQSTMHLVSCRLDAFLSGVTPAMIRELARKHRNREIG